MVRIRAKAIQPARTETPGIAFVNGILPSWCDVECFVVAEDGTETPLVGVKSIRIEASEGDKPLTAVCELYVDEIDVLAERKE